MAKVSVIIPVFNAEKTIKRCLDAICAQTFEDFEAICVNDGSKDCSYSILESFAQKDSRIKVFNQENKGPAYTRNFAISQICPKTKYLMFCDSDDRYEPTMIEDMVNAIETQNTDIVMCDCNVIRENNSNSVSFNDGFFKLILAGTYKIDYEVIKLINILIWNKIFKRELIDKYNITYPDKFEHDDTIFVLKYLCFAESYYGLNKVLYNYFSAHPESIMGKTFANKNDNHKFDFIYCYENLFDFMYATENFRILPYVYDTFAGMFITFYPYLSEEEKEQAIHILKEFVVNIPMEENIIKKEKFLTNNHIRYVEYILNLLKNKKY